MIYVTGWPKSGCTWLTRLLADALNCRAGGATPHKDVKEIAAEGWDRPAPYIVRKTHFVLTDKGEQAVPRAHRLNPNKITTERIIHIIRDPRDVTVSTACYFGIGIREAIYKLRDGWEMPITGGGWNDYMAKWMNVDFATRTSYEALTEGSVKEIIRILEKANLPVDQKRIVAAVGRQSFDRRRQHIKKYPEQYLQRGRHGMSGAEYQLFFLRKGVVGDWRNHFNRKDGRVAQACFGKTMKQLGYIDHDDWWRELPRR